MKRTGDELRKLFLDYFQSRPQSGGHTLIPSSSLVPVGDPTLLLTTAGMVQFKPYFIGQAKPPARRMTSCQKCFRTTDIDSVGDSTHLTFFEMLGNFSVGDYFKKEAIGFAWEFITNKGYLGIPKERLFITVHDTDDEAYNLWHNTIGIPADRIRRYGDDCNWWGPAGTEGPCGPDSEIFYDFGPGHGCRQPDCFPNCPREGCDRFVELWNLVFMQFYQDRDKKRTPLPAPNIDTGMGLERLTAIIQGVGSVYDTDLFQPILQKVAGLCGKRYGENPEVDRAMRVVAEHVRGACFLIADGVIPGNEGRSYVLRRIIRRAVRFGRKLGIQDTSLSDVAQVVIDHVFHQYPKLGQNRGHTVSTLQKEERLFSEALSLGSLMLRGVKEQSAEEDSLVSNMLRNLETPSQEVLTNTKQFLSEFSEGLTGIARSGPISPYQPFLKQDYMTGALDEMELLRDNLSADQREQIREAANSDQSDRMVHALEMIKKSFDESRGKLPGRTAFRFYSTYGFPPEETEAIAKEHGLKGIDWEGFRQAQREHEERSRVGTPTTSAKEGTQSYEALGLRETRFTGYETLVQPTTILALLASGQKVAQASHREEVEVILKETPFYAEMGGQVGDTGTIEGPKGTLEVTDTHSPIASLIVHKGKMTRGTISVGDALTAYVNPQRRADTANNHTTTHLLHAALRQLLGPHVRQHGSLVAPDHLRFDFSHVAPLTQEELKAVEELVNEKIRQNVQVKKQVSTYTQAVQEGALAFFGDRYGEKVNVVEVANGDVFSKEVCGGTHVGHTGDIGMCIVTSESSIGSGLRRIEAVTGRAAQALLHEQRTTLQELARELGAAPGELLPKLKARLEEMDSLKKRLSNLERELSRRSADSLLAGVQEVDGVKLIAARVSATSIEGMRELGDYLKDKLGSTIIVLGAVLEERPRLVVMVTPDLVKRGFDANHIAKNISKTLEGSGGGSPQTAQAGGKDPARLDLALREIPMALSKKGG